MKTIYGKYTQCDTEPIECGCNYIPCNHTTEVLKRYGSNIYDSNSKLSRLIKVLLDYQEQSLSALCELKPLLGTIVEAIGFKSCSYTTLPGDCITICGNSYKTYNFKCQCIDYQYDDTSLLNIIKMVDYINYPSRNNIQAICDIFGWDLIYTTDYINIVVDNPAISKSIISIIPIPVGEQIRILTIC